MNIVGVCGELLFAYLFIDFCGGIVHWFEDQYLSERSNRWVVKYIVQPNRLHHIFPRKTAHCPFWISVLQGMGPGCVFIPLAALALGWGTCTYAMVFFSAIPNFIHKWNHRTESERPYAFKILQRLYLVQGPQHHNRHHTEQQDAGYCVMSPWLNPLLDRIGFWRGLEALVFTITRRRANSVAEPGRFYRLHQGQVLEYQFNDNTWTPWPHMRRYQRAVR
jgi:hypothetical protein